MTVKSNKNKKKIPEKHLNQKMSPEIQHCEAVLSNAVQRIFNEAGNRGYRELQKAEHE
jgi:hypothetical protein